MHRKLEQIVEGYRRFAFDGADDDEAHFAFIALDDLIESDAESAWLAISRLIEEASTHARLWALGAGPLEDILRMHGELVLERLVSAASANPSYRHASQAMFAHALPAAVEKRLRELEMF